MGIKSVLASGIIVGVSIAALATCAGVKPANAGEAAFAVHFEGLKASHDLKWQLTCVAECEGGKAEAERLANTPRSGVAKFGRDLPGGVWALKVTSKVVTQPVLPKQPAACTASLNFTTCGKGKMCGQQHNFVCTTEGGTMRQ